MTPKETLFENGFSPEMGAESFVEACKRGLGDVVRAWLALGMSANAASDLPPLVAAAGSGSLDAVEALLDQGAELEARDNQGRTAFHCSAIWNHLEVAQLLARRGAQVDATDDDGLSPLAEAIRSGETGKCAWLLELGAHANGQSAMRQAIEHHPPMLARLLGAGAAANQVLDEHGVTALHHAVRQKCERSVEILLAHGASVAAVDAYGRSVYDYALLVGFVALDVPYTYSERTVALTSLWSALRDNQDEALRVIATDPTLAGARNHLHETPLMMFAGAGHEEGVLLLSEARVDLDAGSSETCALGRAVKENRLACVEHLLAAGASPLNANGKLCGLQAALEAKDPSCALLLLHAAARLKLPAVARALAAKNRVGETALMKECNANPIRPEIIHALVEAGANVTAVNAAGKTALAMLFSSSSWQDHSLFGLFLERGARLDTIDERGDTPISQRCSEGTREFLKRELVTGPLEAGVAIAELAKRHSWATLPLVVSCGRKDVALALVDAGVPIDPPAGVEAEGLLATHDADLVRAALARGANPNHASVPLARVVRLEYAETIQLLLDAGADVCHPKVALATVEKSKRQVWLQKLGGRFDDRPASTLVEAVRDKNAAAVKFFLAHGAPVDVRNKNGYTPLTLAILFKQRKIIDLLIEAGASFGYTDRRGEGPLAAAARYSPALFRMLAADARVPIDARAALAIEHALAALTAVPIDDAELARLAPILAARIVRSSEKCAGAAAAMIAFLDEHGAPIRTLVADQFAGVLVGPRLSERGLARAADFVPALGTAAFVLAGPLAAGLMQSFDEKWAPKCAKQVIGTLARLEPSADVRALLRPLIEHADDELREATIALLRAHSDTVSSLRQTWADAPVSRDVVAALKRLGARPSGAPYPSGVHLPTSWWNPDTNKDWATKDETGFQAVLSPAIDFFERLGWPHNDAGYRAYIPYLDHPLIVHFGGASEGLDVREKGKRRLFYVIAHDESQYHYYVNLLDKRTDPSVWRVDHDEQPADAMAPQPLSSWLRTFRAPE